MAESQHLYEYDASSETSLRTSLTEPRLGKYLREAGRDFNYTMALYLWNARLCKALQFPIHALEVTLRNSINEHLRELGWPENWAFDQGYLESLSTKSKAAIESQNRSKRRLLENRMKKTDFNREVRDVEFTFVPSCGRLNTNDIIASLPFEYWVGMLSGVHESDWHITLKKVLPKIPKTETRRSLWLAADRIKALRNRVSHHEPIFNMGEIVSTHQNILDLIGYKDETMKGWVRHHSTFLQVWHDKPRRDNQKSGRKLKAFAEKVQCLDDFDISIIDLLKASQRRRRNCVALRHDGLIKIITSDDVTAWLQSCDEVGLADLGISIRDFLEIIDSKQRVEILGEDATTGMAHELFHSAESSAKPSVIVLTSNGQADGDIRGAVFKPDFLI